MSVNNYKEQGTMEKNIITAGLYKDAKIESDDDGAFIIAEIDNEKKVTIYYKFSPLNDKVS